MISQMLARYDRQISNIRKKQLELVSKCIKGIFAPLLATAASGCVIKLEISLTHEFDGWVTVSCNVINSDFSKPRYRKYLHETLIFLQDCSFVFADVNGTAVHEVGALASEPLDFKLSS